MIAEVPVLAGSAAATGAVHTAAGLTLAAGAALVLGGVGMVLGF